MHDHRLAMKLALVLIAIATTSHAEDKVQITGSWSGKFRENTLEKHAPQKGFISNPNDWKALWQSWRPQQAVPKIDFDQELVLVGIVQGPNTVFLFPLIKDGKLSFATGGTKVGGPGFGYKLVKIPRAGIQSIQGHPLNAASVQGMVQIPQAVAAFDQHQLEIKLWEYDPFLADVGAKLVDTFRLEKYAHSGDETTKTSFQVGAKHTPQPNRRYYITVFILKDGKRTHIGERDGKSGLCNVLSDGKPTQVNMIIRSVR
ncbi:MAG TPA: hypothetical protein DCY79_19960 [Planctomycetaceae bacterium]|nr:hypothetical protein [Planctomycetaceae bacterium]